jgi:hypothetical protein
MTVTIVDPTTGREARFEQMDAFFIDTYVPEAANNHLSIGEAFQLAMQRDQEAAEALKHDAITQLNIPEVEIPN